MTSYFTPFLSLRLFMGRLLTPLLTRLAVYVPRLRDNLPPPTEAVPASSNAQHEPSHHRTRVWVCMKHRTDGRPSCAVGSGHGTAAELLAALEHQLAAAIETNPRLAPDATLCLDVRPAGCLDLCDHGLVAIAHTGPAADRAKPPKSRLDRLLNPRLAQFTDATPADAQALLRSLLPPAPTTRHQ